jgi:hypothetical protein
MAFPEYLMLKFYYQFCLQFYLLFIFINCNSNSEELPTVNTSNNFLENHRTFKTLDLVKGDTLDKNSNDYNTRMPGGFNYEFTPEQDSAYYRALRHRLPVTTRLNFDLNSFANAIAAEMQKLEDEPWRIAMKSLQAVPDEFFIPSDVEKVQFESNIRMSQYIPHIPTLYPYGLKVGVGDVLTFLGLMEDVSPVIKYKLDYQDEIEIVVYSINATVIATLFNGIQVPGSYSITWNGRDDKGRRILSGDYIAEVRIGKERYIRKRIVIP